MKSQHECLARNPMGPRCVHILRSPSSPRKNLSRSHPEAPLAIPQRRQVSIICLFDEASDCGGLFIHISVCRSRRFAFLPRAFYKEGVNLFRERKCDPPPLPTSYRRQPQHVIFFLYSHILLFLRIKSFGLSSPHLWL